MRRRLNGRLRERWADSIAEAIGSDESVFDRWIGVFEVMLVFGRLRVARSFALDGRSSLPEKVDFFRSTVGESLGGILPDHIDRLFVPLLEGDFWWVLPVLKEGIVRRFDDRVGRVQVEIFSPQTLSSDLRNRILQGLDRVVNTGTGLATGMRKGKGGGSTLSVRPVWNIRKSLLAGIEIRIGSRAWDASLAARLRALERQLLTTA